MGQMMATNLAFVAQLESENTSKRVVNTQNHLRRVGRWTGGPVPYGYAPTRVSGKPGWYLGLDESAEVLREAVNKVLGGLAPNHVAEWLNDQGVMTPLDRARVLQGKPRLCQCGHDEHEEPCGKLHKCHHRKRVDGKYAKLHEFDECSEPCPAFKPRRWIRASLYEILRSPALMGYTVEHDAILRDDQGMPVSFAPGVIDEFLVIAATATFRTVSSDDRAGRPRGEPADVDDPAPARGPHVRHEGPDAPQVAEHLLGRYGHRGAPSVAP